MNINGYVLENEEKIARAIKGTLSRDGRLAGGLETMAGWDKLPEEEKNALILGQYDRLGGLITKKEVNVKIGSFYDFVNKIARPEPIVVFEMNLEGELVEVDEEEAVSINKAKKKTEELKAKKKKKAKKKADK